MVSDIYFPIPPSPYPALYPISYPLNFYPQSPQRHVSSLQSMLPGNTTTKSTKRHDNLVDANRNHVVPYYYSETLAHSMPNSHYSVSNISLTNRNRHTFMCPDDRQDNYQRTQTTRLSPKLQSRISSPASPYFNQIYAKSNVYQPQSFRPYSVLETTSKSPIPNLQRPSSVVPMSEQFRPASAFFQLDEKPNKVPEWKARLQREILRPNFKCLDRPIRQICRIPNCKCNEKPIVDPDRFIQVKTLPSVSERSLSKIKNLSLPTLKLDELEKDERSDKTEAERDLTSAVSRPISEQHLGYV